MTTGSFVTRAGIVNRTETELTLTPTGGNKPILKLKGDKAASEWAKIEAAYDHYWNDGCRDFRPVELIVQTLFIAARRRSRKERRP